MTYDVVKRKTKHDANSSYNETTVTTTTNNSHTRQQQKLAQEIFFWRKRVLFFSVFVFCLNLSQFKLCFEKKKKKKRAIGRAHS